MSPMIFVKDNAVPGLDEWPRLTKYAAGSDALRGFTNILLQCTGPRSETERACTLAVHRLCTSGLFVASRDRNDGGFENTIHLPVMSTCPNPPKLIDWLDFSIAGAAENTASPAPEFES